LRRWPSFLLLAAACTQPPARIPYALIDHLEQAEGYLSPAAIDPRSARELFGNGWQIGKEPGVLWIHVAGATLRYRTHGRFERRLRFELRAAASELAFTPTLELWSDDGLLQSYALGPRWRREELALPPGRGDGEARKLEWRYRRSRLAPGRPPNRVVAVRNLQFTYLTLRDAILGPQARQCLTLMASGVLRYRLALPPQPRLEFGFGLQAPAGSAPAHFEVLLQGERIWEGSAMPGSFHDVRLRLPPVPGNVADLALRAGRDASSPGRLLWAHPVVAGADSVTKPNVILLSVDTLRADHLGCYGYSQPTSPTIDRLASQGIRFAAAQSVFPGTLPAHASLLTSLYPNRHRVYPTPRPGLRVEPAIPRQLPTLATELALQGYRRVAWTGGGYLSPRRGFHRGFERFQTPEGEGGHDLEETLAPASEWLRAGPVEPFFLFLHTYEVHEPFEPPAEYLRRFESSYDGPLPNSIHPFDFPRLRQARLSQADQAHLLALYDAEIRYLDDAIADLLRSLRRAGLERRTLVVLTSDHGEELFDRGDIGHGTHLHRELIQVPLIFRWPGRLPAGRVVPLPVSLVDVAPTILEAVRAPLPPGFQGHSLWPALRGESIAARTVASETTWRGGSVAARQGGYKLFYDLPSKSEHLYDLSRDRKEMNDLGPKAAAAHPELRAAVRQYVRELRSRPAGPAVRGAPKLSAAERAKLKALGYLQ
jgi:arylsulfatase A-like enzyme